MTARLTREEAACQRGLALIAKARRARLDERAGTTGIIAAALGILWMLGKCGPTLLPYLFQ